MRRFYAIAESRWSDRKQPPHWIRFFREESVAELFPPETRRAMRAALDEAEAAFPPLVDDAGRTERRRMRVRAASVSFAKFERFAVWYEARKALAGMPEATDLAGVARVRESLARCLAGEREYRAAVARWNACALNPGAPYDPDIYWTADARALAASKCGAFWKNFPREPDASGLSRAAVAVLADKPPEGVETVAADTFGPNRSGRREPTWAAAKKTDGAPRRRGD